jgi:arsenite methyltransferase
MEKSDITEVVRKKYAQAALRAGGTCCGAAPMANVSPITSNLYDQSQTDDLPEAALLASLGCGNPTALAELRPGETVLDLGSGGGIDVLLSARRVGPTGKAYGLDMTLGRTSARWPLPMSSSSKARSRISRFQTTPST